MESIIVNIQKEDFTFLPMEVPLGVQLSLMEVLKGEGYPIKDEILLEGANDDELCMLDTLPCNTGNCRLTCQIQISEKINGIKIRIPTND